MAPSSAFPRMPALQARIMASIKPSESSVEHRIERCAYGSCCEEMSSADCSYGSCCVEMSSAVDCSEACEICETSENTRGASPSF